MTRRFTRKNRLDTHQRHIKPLMIYKSLFYLYNSYFLTNPRIKNTWVNYEKDWRTYSNLIIKSKGVI